jgi:hypothetical protein
MLELRRVGSQPALLDTAMQDLNKISAEDIYILEHQGFTHVGQLSGKADDITGRISTSLDTDYLEGMEKN